MFGTPQHWQRREYDWRRQNIKHNGKPFTRVEFLALWEIQKATCPVCVRPFGDRLVAVDHNHSTHEARGLLCAMPCNKFLVAKNTPATSERVAAYLGMPPALWLK